MTVPPTAQSPALGISFRYPLPGLVFQEGLDECVQGMNVPGLVDKMDSSEAGRKAVLGGEERNKAISTHAQRLARTPVPQGPWHSSPEMDLPRRQPMTGTDGKRPLSSC